MHHNFLHRRFLISQSHSFRTFNEACTEGFHPSLNPMYVFWENPELAAPDGRLLEGPSGWYRLLDMPKTPTEDPSEAVLVKVMVDVAIWKTDEPAIEIFTVTDSFLQGSTKLLIVL